MISAHISGSSVQLLTLDKNYLGKFGIKGASRIVLQEGEKWEDKINSLIKGEKLAFTLPDSKTYLHRFSIPGDFKGAALVSTVLSKANEIIPSPIEHLIYDFSIVGFDKVKNIQDILFIAISYDNLLEYYKTLQTFNVTPILAIPESLAIYNVLKRSIAGDEAVMYISLEKKISVVSFHDSFGPVVNLSEPVQTIKLQEELKRAISFYKDRYHKEVKKAIIGGEGSLVINTKEFQTFTGMPTISVEDVLKNTLNDLKQQVNTGDVPISLFATVIGLSLQTTQEEGLNLAKKNTLAQLTLQKKDKLQTSNLTINQRATSATTSTNIDTSAVQPENSEIDKTSGKNPSKIIKIVAIVVIWILLMGLLFRVLSTKSTISNKKPVLKGGNTTSSVEVLTSTPTPEPEIIIDKKSVKIAVLNGTGVKGLASKTGQFLDNLGYTVEKTANAESDTYSQTVIQIKKGKEAYLPLITNDLKSDYEISGKTETLENSNEFDVIIIVGSK